MGGKQSKEKRREYYLRNRKEILKRGKTNKCIDCECLIDKRAKRCKPCNYKHLRKFDRKYEIGELVKKCKCGCGNFIVFKRNHIYYGTPNYILGHRPSPRKGKGKIYTARKCSICKKPVTREQLRARKSCCSKKCRKESHSRNGKRNRMKQKIPQKDTSIEVIIQNMLTKLDINFFTHQYIKEIEHSYQCDILIPVQKGINQKTIIECDGDYWHANLQVYPLYKFSEKILKHKEQDKLRTEELIKKGFRVIRLWENEIKVMKLNDFYNKLNIQNIQLILK